MRREEVAGACYSALREMRLRVGCYSGNRDCRGVERRAGRWHYLGTSPSLRTLLRSASSAKPRPVARLCGAGEGTRTLDIQLGKLTLWEGHHVLLCPLRDRRGQDACSPRDIRDIRGHLAQNVREFPAPSRHTGRPDRVLAGRPEPSQSWGSGALREARWRPSESRYGSPDMRPRAGADGSPAW